MDDQMSILWMAFIDVLMFSSVILIALLNLLSSNLKVPHFIVSLLSYLSLPIITYTIGRASTSVDSSSSMGTSPIFLLSTIILHLLYVKVTPSDDGTVVFTNLHDLHQSKKLPFRQMSTFVWIGFLLIFSSSSDTQTDEIVLTILLLLGLNMLELTLRHVSLKLAVHSVVFNGKKNAKFISSYMKQVHQQETEEELQLDEEEELSVSPMQDCKYLVKGEEKQKIKLCKDGYKVAATANKLITVDKIWGKKDECNNKDTMLAFALFKLLRLRFEGFPPPAESSRSKRALLRLFLNDGAGAADRTFRILEVELAFLTDSLFSTLPLTYYNLSIVLNLVILVIALCYCYLYKIVIQAAIDHTYFTRYYEPFDLLDNHKKVLFHLDLILCLIILSVPLSMELAKLWACTFSNWSKLGCLHSLLHIKLWCSYLVRWFPCLENYWSTTPQNYEMKLRMGQCCLLSNKKKLKRIKVGKQVREAIIKSLKRSNGQLISTTITSASAWRRMLPQIQNISSNTERVLVCHIATSFCERNANTRSTKEDRFVASCLSRYCAHLVDNVPELIISDDVEWIRSIVKGVRHEATKCININITASEEGIQGEAKKLTDLGKQLGQKLMSEIKDEGKLWKELGDLWADMFLCLAPSDNVEAHKKCLPKGGEFITFIWALLSHAGITDKLIPELPV